MKHDDVTIIHCCGCSTMEQPTRLLGPKSAARAAQGDSLPPFAALLPRVGESLPDGRALCRDCAGVADDEGTDLVFDEAEGEEAGVTSSASVVTPQVAQDASERSH